jgi:hypothetical protein
VAWDDPNFNEKWWCLGKHKCLSMIDSFEAGKLEQDSACVTEMGFYGLSFVIKVDLNLQL